MPFRTSRFSSLVAMFIAVTLTGCGGGGMTGLPIGAPDAGSLPVGQVEETGGLSLRITRSDVGLPPASGRAEGEVPSVAVVLTAQGQTDVAPDPKTLEGDAVEFQVTGLTPATWTITVAVTVGQVVLADGWTVATVERGQTTEAFVPLVTTAPAPTAGNVTLGVGTLVNVPNGTEIQAGSDQTWVVRAPTVYVEGIDNYPGQEERMRVELFATNGGDTRSNDDYITISEYRSADGSQPELETNDSGSLLRAVRMKAGDVMTLRWSQVPDQREVVIRTQRGVLRTLPGMEEELFDSSEEFVSYRYPILH